MDPTPLSDTHVIEYSPLPSPQELKEKLPLTDKAWNTVYTARRGIEAILDGKDSRNIVIVGPCSIHDLEQAQEYACRLAGVARQVQDKWVVVMRTYFEKPRTTRGWKGFINDPEMNGSSNIAEGRTLARQLLLYLAELGLPAATETLSTRNIQCYDHLISYACIGARTTEAQTHRELASGLAMPVGFKNGTSGDIGVAIDAVTASRYPQQFDGMLSDGREAVVHTKGNPYTHIVLRGGKDGPNYDEEKVKYAQRLLEGCHLHPRLFVDCSHDNSGKNHEFQPVVFANVLQQIAGGNQGIVGVMLESNLFPGRQRIPEDLRGFNRSTLEYGRSVTDACMGWGQTEELLMKAYTAL